LSINPRVFSENYFGGGSLPLAPTAFGERFLMPEKKFSLSNASFLRKTDLPNIILNYITVHMARPPGRTLFFELSDY
jgi:hypothetical protein